MFKFDELDYRIMWQSSPVNNILRDPVNRIHEQYLFKVIFHLSVDFICWVVSSLHRGDWEDGSTTVLSLASKWNARKNKFNEYISIKHASTQQTMHWNRLVNGDEFLCFKNSKSINHRINIKAFFLYCYTYKTYMWWWKMI